MKSVFSRVLALPVVYTFISLACIVQVQADATTMIASHYGPGFNGRKTASGVIFNTSNPHMAASRTLPFGTKLNLCELSSTGKCKCEWVIIVDRGPYVYTRQLDISTAAAINLGFQGVKKLLVTQAGHVPNYKALFGFRIASQR